MAVVNARAVRRPTCLHGHCFLVLVVLLCATCASANLGDVVHENVTLAAQECALLMKWPVPKNYSFAAFIGMIRGCNPLPPCPILQPSDVLSANGIGCDGDGHLTHLYLKGESLGGTLPPEWSGLQSLVYIHLHDLGIGKLLPDSWGQLTKLVTLHLSVNNFFSTLPSSWGDMASLERLELYSNMFHGPIPATWGRMTKLRVLQLSRNDLTGTLPASLADLGASLTNLHLDANHLNGTLPDSWSALNNMSWMNLNKNAFTGTLPPSWSSMTGLTKLYLDNDPYLTGPIPASWASMSQLAILTTENSNFCGSAPSNTNATALPSCDTVKVPHPPGYCPASADKSSHKTMLIAVAAALSICLLLLIAALVYTCFKHRGMFHAPPELKATLPPTAWTTDVEAAPPAKAVDNRPYQPSDHAAPAAIIARRPASGASPLKQEQKELLLQPQHQSSAAQVESAPAAGGTRGVAGPPKDTPAAPDAALSAASAAQSLQSAPLTRPRPAAVLVHSAPAAQSMRSSTGADLWRAPPVAVPMAPRTQLPSGSVMASGAGAGGGGGVPERGGVAGGASAHGGVDPASALVGGVVLGSVLPQCIYLAQSIIASGDRVVANHARCSNIITRINSLLPLLKSLPTRLQPRGEQGARQLEELQPVMANIQAVLSDVHECIRQWCADHARGAIATVLRNLGASTWFQEAFLDLNRRLSDAYSDLGLALNIQQGELLRPDASRLEAEAHDDTARDLMGLVEELVADDGGGEEVWGSLSQREREKLLSIFKHHNIDLTTTVRTARQEAIDKKVGHLMIPKRDITELKTLGSGGYGTVVQGLWKPDTPVALKKLNLGTLTERAKSDIKREAYMMSMVHSHPNVCKCYGLVLEEPNECALVMELYPRGSLLQLLHDDCTVLTWRNKLQLALDVAKGMAHLHTRQRPIVHGDLKPGNILVQDDGHVVVADFGLACIASLTLTFAATTSSSTSQNVSSGMSVLYAPPEILALPSSARTASGDVYAFSILMLEIATQKVAINFSEYGAVMHFVLQGRRPDIPASVPPAYSSLIRRCWMQDPDLRPSFTDISSSLFRQLSELP